jgi:copper transport protein
MPVDHPAPRRLVASLIGFAAAVATLLPGATPAVAATTLESSTPAADEQVATSPTELRLVFSEVVPIETVVEVVCSGQPAPLGPSRLEADQRTVTVPVIGLLPRGKCNVLWQVPQVDGSIAQGTYSFDVLGDTSATTAAPSDTAAPTEGTDSSEAPTTDGGEAADGGEAPRVGGLLGLSRLVAYVALFALFGALVLIGASWPEGVDYLITLRFLRLMWGVALAATVATVVFTTSRTTGDSVAASLSPAAWADLLDTTDGKVLLARLVLVAASGPVAFRPERVLDPGAQLVALGLPGLAVASLGISRTSSDLAVLGVVAGIVHALAVAVWFGGLVLLSRVVLVGPGEEDLVHAVRGYGRSSNAMLLLAVVTGAIQTYRLDGGSLFTSTHGRLLLLKVLGVAAMAYVGTSLRHFVLARLHRHDHLDARMAARLRRAVGTEAVFGVFVLAITSWMVSTLPANVEPPGTDTTDYAYVSDRSAGELDVRLMLHPARVGPNQVRLELYEPAEGVSGLTVRFNPPVDASGVGGVVLTVPLDGAGAALLPRSQGVPLGAAGVWTVEVTADGPNGRLPAATFAVAIVEASGSATTTSPATNPSTAVVPLDTSTTSPTAPATDTAASP